MLWEIGKVESCGGKSRMSLGGFNSGIGTLTFPELFRERNGDGGRGGAVSFWINCGTNWALFFGCVWFCIWVDEFM